MICNTKQILFCIIFFAGTATACDRSAFKHWSDQDGDGRDTREQMIEEQDRGGWWYGYYSGTIIGIPGEIDIDHVIPLCLAWEWGADQWSDELRQQFANDRLNLILVHRAPNRSKGARPPSDWMPANTAIWGPYIAQVHAVLDKYPLTPPDAELDALADYSRFVRRTGKGFRPGYWSRTRFQ